ncbi:MAG: ABC transporter substrate-binding protein [Actinomycetota bacterium]
MNTKKRSRWPLLFVLLLVVALVASACSSSTDDGEGSDATTTTAGQDGGDATTTTSGGDDGGDDGGDAPTGDLVVGRVGDIDILDPHLATAFQSVRTLDLVYDGLLTLDADLAVGPGLAESWEFSDDGLTLTMSLQEGVTFHDGSAFDSEDVAASLNRVLDEETGAVVRANLLAITDIATPDANTVVLTLANVDASILTSLADVNAAILSSDAIAAGTVDREPNGTGAFAWNEWKQGSSVTLTANEGYWGDGPYVASLEFRIIPDENSVLAGMKAGEVHVGVLTDPAVVLQAGDPLTVHRTPALAYHALMMNSSREPLSDQKVRQAISCAIDRQQVIDTAALGEGEVTGPITIPAYRSSTAGLPCGGERDIDTAKDLLAQAGYADGFTLNTIVIALETLTAIAEGENLAAQLAEVGITLELEILETGTYVDRWLAADFDAAVALNSGKADPHQLYARYWPSTGNLNGVASYNSPMLDELFAAGQVETDPAVRVGIYDQISEELQAQSPWIWVFTGFEYRVATDAVSGFVPMPNGSLQYLKQTKLG